MGTHTYAGLPGAARLKNEIRSLETGTLLVLDVVDLGKVRETYGHRYGNALLQALYLYLCEQQLPGAELYKLNTANFGLLVRGEAEYMESVARRLLKDCARPWDIRLGSVTKQVHFHVAIGILPLVAPLDDNLAYFSTVIEYTLERAIRSGGLAQFDEKERQTAKRHIRLELEMRDAMTNGMKGFSLMYQPIVDPANGAWKGVEALCRWTSENYGPVSPEEFIGLAEAGGLIHTLGLWVLEHAIEQIQALGVDKAPGFVLDVNVSPVQLADPRLDEKILDILSRQEYPAEKLCLEITESSDVNIDGHLLKMMNRLREQGVRLALDDFGVGYASVSSLYKLPINVVKTDRSLVQGVEDNEFLQKIFYLMGEMAHACDMTIVAEGVESGEQQTAVLAEGADYIQGFLHHPPLGVDALRENRGRFFAA